MVTQVSYIPSRGDIIYIDLNPTKGHEQKGRRPAFVISPKIYNERSSLALLMPITKQQKGYTFEVILPPEIKTKGVVLTDQIRCVDWKARDIKFVESVPIDVIKEVQARIEPLLFD